MLNASLYVNCQIFLLSQHLFIIVQHYYRDTGYSDTLLTATCFFGTKKNRLILKRFGYNDTLLTVTLFPCPKGVTVIGDVCISSFP